jgi:P2 family phage contractile tail tube protein
MTAPLLVLERGNLWVDNEDGSPGDSNHLVVQEMKLPAIEEQYVEHNAGGAMLGVEVPTFINRLEAPFNLTGWTPQVMKLIGRTGVAALPFHLRGAVRDRLTGDLFEAEAEIRGRLGRVNPTAYQRNNNMGHEYSIRAITKYSLKLGGDEIYYFDFFLSIMRIGGVDQERALLSILGVASGPAGIVTAPTITPATNG